MELQFLIACAVVDGEYEAVSLSLSGLFECCSIIVDCGYAWFFNPFESGHLPHTFSFYCRPVRTGHPPLR